MSALIEHAERLRAVVDIAEVVGRYVELKRAGVNLKGLCPFHREKTPSFTVNPPKGIFHCFGCNKGGDAIKFLQEIEHLEWVEALRLLSEQHGMPLPPREGRDKVGEEKSRSEREKLVDLTRLASDQFAKRLAQEMKTGRGAAAEYLKGRAIDFAAVDRFAIGLAADSWTDLTDSMRRAGYSDDTLVSAGLANRNEKNRVYDRFRNRIIFPIQDTLGRPIAFGARVYAADAAADEPKYVNSPETPLYRKGQQLYALHLAKDAIVRSRRALLMEGYLDVIRAHMHGFTEAVATCGTALTDEQAKQLRRFAETVVFVYDGDEAGQKAMLRGTEILLEHGFQVRVVALPGEHDPDTFLAQYGSAAFGTAVEKAQPFLDFFLGAAARRYGISTPDGKAKTADEVQPLLRRIQNPVAAAEYLRRTADFLDVAPEALSKLFAKPVHPLRPQQQARIETASVIDVPRAQVSARDRGLIRLLVESPTARTYCFAEVSAGLFANDQIRWFFEQIRLLTAQQLPVDYETMHAACENEDDHALLRGAELSEEPLDEGLRNMKNIVARIRREAIGRGAERLRRKMRSEAQDDSDDSDATETTDNAIKEIGELTAGISEMKNEVLLRTGDGSKPGL